jgi:hypothetical protein
MHLAGGAAIFGLFIVGYFAVIVFGLYTRRGSGINQRPYHDSHGDAPGAKGGSRMAHDPVAFSNYSRGTR